MKSRSVIALFTLAALVAIPVAARTLTPPSTLSCMRTAVEKRENAIITAFDTRTAAVRAALTIRRDALAAGWGIADRRERRAALRSAWQAYRDARASAVHAFRQSRHAAWAQSRRDARVCRAHPVVEEGSTEAVDLGT